MLSFKTLDLCTKSCTDIRTKVLVSLFNSILRLPCRPDPLFRLQTIRCCLLLFRQRPASLPSILRLTGSAILSRTCAAHLDFFICLLFPCILLLLLFLLFLLLLPYLLFLCLFFCFLQHFLLFLLVLCPYLLLLLFFHCYAVFIRQLPFCVILFSLGFLRPVLRAFVHLSFFLHLFLIHLGILAICLHILILHLKFYAFLLYTFLILGLTNFLVISTFSGLSNSCRLNVCCFVLFDCLVNFSGILGPIGLGDLSTKSCLGLLWSIRVLLAISAQGVRSHQNEQDSGNAHSRRKFTAYVQTRAPVLENNMAELGHLGP
mmetsp:Transcript_83656/g.148194  ORF Transcript_83656/g.148194 Transcript_83656/m.148194 type:complete len:317 (+) Transcript_83656:994-1944(+)